ncbi:hypothetical protein QR680_007858 [Steinernema hermaphroditum]|uniref:Uncharacterized protein n=1 Tax=Steinernema hermaphroditum TaxID=289476 RepID=A0AA39IGY4_9BILA|nr:hypothetical protein QR680_007858 [Steinernema hermaphroditum]
MATGLPFSVKSHTITKEQKGYCGIFVLLFVLLCLVDSPFKSSRTQSLLISFIGVCLSGVVYRYVIKDKLEKYYDLPM